MYFKIISAACTLQAERPRSWQLLETAPYSNQPHVCIMGQQDALEEKYYPICGHYVIILYWRLLAGEPYALNAIYQDV